jgi:hypothetical protein
MKERIETIETIVNGVFNVLLFGLPQGIAFGIVLFVYAVYLQLLRVATIAKPRTITG